jgi:hypothetical protein
MKVDIKTKLETPCNPAANRVLGHPQEEMRAGEFINKYM